MATDTQHPEATETSGSIIMCNHMDMTGIHENKIHLHNISLASQSVIILLCGRLVSFFLSTAKTPVRPVGQFSQKGFSTSKGGFGKLSGSKSHASFMISWIQESQSLLFS